MAVESVVEMLLFGCWCYIFGLWSGICPFQMYFLSVKKRFGTGIGNAHIGHGISYYLHEELSKYDMITKFLAHFPLFASRRTCRVVDVLDDDAGALDRDYHCEECCPRGGGGGVQKRSSLSGIVLDDLHDRISDVKLSILFNEAIEWTGCDGRR